MRFGAHNFHNTGLDVVFGRSCTIDELTETVDRFPAFEPHALLRSGHLQTIVGTVISGQRSSYRAVRYSVILPDGDMAMLHDDCPDAWQPTSPSALLVHGLAGCHQSAYVVNAARRLNEAGVRTFRMDMRACGAVEGLSRLPYHGGCSRDLYIALNRVAEICPASPISLVGFSIGGNTALKLVGESADELPPQLDRLVVVSPPIDLGACVNRFPQVAGGFYDRKFAKAHHRQLQRSTMLTVNAPALDRALAAQGQREFDQWYTAPAWGFDSVDQFYAETSSQHAIPNIRIPTLLIASRDDPLVPVKLFEPLDSLGLIKQYLTDHGGHMGFIGRRGTDPDRRWIDWRIVDYVTARSSMSAAAAA